MKAVDNALSTYLRKCLFFLSFLLIWKVLLASSQSNIDCRLPFAFVMNGGFENGYGWENDSQFYGTPICNTQFCGTSPRSGEWWVWFGGVDDTIEEAFVSQKILLNPPESNSDYILTKLQFWFFIEAQGGARGQFRVLLDENILWEADQNNFEYHSVWRKVEIDLSHFVNFMEEDSTGCYTLRLEGSTQSTRPNAVVSFFVDDIEILFEECMDTSCWSDPLTGSVCSDHTDEMCISESTDEFHEDSQSLHHNCCACGGGSVKCVDLPNWSDADGRTCCDYALNAQELCLNLEASQSCCICGGGKEITEAPTPSPTPLSTHVPTPRPSEDPTAQPTSIPTILPTPEPLPQFCCRSEDLSFLVSSSTDEEHCANENDFICCSTGEWKCLEPCISEGVVCGSIPYYEDFEHSISDNTSHSWVAQGSWSFGDLQTGSMHLTHLTSHSGNNSLVFASARQNFDGINELILSISLIGSNIFENTVILQFWWTHFGETSDEYFDAISIRNSARPETGWKNVLNLQPEVYRDNVWFPERVDLTLEASRHDIVMDQYFQILFSQKGNQISALSEEFGEGAGLAFDDISVFFDGPYESYSYHFHSVSSDYDTWYTAELVCTEFYVNGHLVTPKDRTQNRELREICFYATGGEEEYLGNCWIGLTDDTLYSDPENWVWVDDLNTPVFVGLSDGVPFFPVHWATARSPFQPSSSSQNCARWRNNDDRDDMSLWADNECNQDRDYICQEPIELYHYPFTALWGDAEEKCREKDGHLASISTHSQNTVVREICQHEECWIGLRTTLNDSTKYSFSDHPKFVVFKSESFVNETAGTEHQNSTQHSFINWENSTQPSDFNTWTRGGCVVLLPSGKWKVENCKTYRSAFVCSLPVFDSDDTIVPAPEVSDEEHFSDSSFSDEIELPERCCDPKPPGSCPFGSTCCSDGIWKCDEFSGDTRCGGQIGQICESNSDDDYDCPDSLLNAEGSLCVLDSFCFFDIISCCDNEFEKYICECNESGIFSCTETGFCNDDESDC